MTMDQYVSLAILGAAVLLFTGAGLPVRLRDDRRLGWVRLVLALALLTLGVRLGLFSVGVRVRSSGWRI